MFPTRISKVDPSNRRRAGRVRCEQTSCQHGPIIEMSKSGVSVLTSRRMTLPEGKFVLLKITCAGRTLVVPARPVISRRAKSGGYRTGFKFQGLDDRAAEHMLELVRTASSTDGCLHRMMFPHMRRR